MDKITTFDGETVYIARTRHHSRSARSVGSAPPCNNDPLDGIRSGRVRVMWVEDDGRCQREAMWCPWLGWRPLGVTAEEAETLIGGE